MVTHRTKKSLDLQVDLRVYDASVSTPYRIKEIADRSGFSATTLRYYEEIGLLPEASRTAAGYRLYDDQTLDRLAFIARAKQLGCSLDEIADLTIAWDGGRCGPVQVRLRAVVADKLLTARQQIVDLTALTADLRRAAATLETHRREGPCDDRCGCITDSADTTGAATPQPVTLSGLPARAPGTTPTAPIACTLGSNSMRDRLDEWRGLLAHVEQREPIDGGLRATFGPATPLGELMRLAAAEQDCCQFLTFAITVDSRGVALEVRAPQDALPILQSLFGAPV